MSIREFVSKSNVQVVIGITIVVTCLAGLIFFNLTNDVKIVFAGFIGQVLNFYFGSSRGSQLKDIDRKN